jgi:VanZ family protein
MKALTEVTPRLFGWLLALLITALSLLPPDFRPETGAPHHFEHFAIFCATGVAFGAGYTNGRGALAAALVFFAGAIEFAQIFAPGRHARLSDFIVDAAAICIGVGLSMFATNFTSAHRARP